MKNVLIAVALITSLAASPAFAGAQQEKMKSCNAEAKTKALKGDERKAFMKTCLSADGGAAAAEPAMDKKKAQQEKMKTCNADAKAKALKGDERKAFMKSCLSGG